MATHTYTYRCQICGYEWDVEEPINEEFGTHAPGVHECPEPD